MKKARRFSLLVTALVAVASSFALHAARHYGCHVTTTTVSRAQFEVATARIAAAGRGIEDQARPDELGAPQGRRRVTALGASARSSGSSSGTIV